MENKYLVTFEIFIKEINKSILSYAWFGTEEDIDDFISSADNNITITEKFKITSCESL